jgi:hypothetical protein
MPFYIKEGGESWVELKQPVDIRDNDHRVLASVYPGSRLRKKDIDSNEPTDPEKMVVTVPSDAHVIVTGERGERIFPGQEGEINRDDIFIQNLCDGSIRAVIHSEKPIK